MQKLSSKEVTDALKSMVAELTSVKKQAADYAGEVSDMKPEEFVGGEGPEAEGVNFPPSEENAENEAGEEVGEEAGEEKGEGEEKEPKIKTKEDAKKVLDKAIKDLQEVVDNLDGITGAAESEIKEAKVERFNEKYASRLSKLSETAEKGIADAKDALKHWAFLKRAHQPIRSIKNPNLRQTLETVKEASTFYKVLGNLFGKKEVTATAVPPTGAEFSGDKWPSKSGDPKMVEDRAWHSSAEKFNKDKKFEDARPNSAVENRLNTVEYSRDDKPHVNASFVFNDKDPYLSYWDIVDTKVGKRITANFLNTPDELGEKDEKGDAFKFFSSRAYGERIVENVMRKEQEKEAKLSSKNPGSAIDGIDFVKNTLNGKYARLTSEARAPKIKDKAAVRKYYSDMYGDAEFARELTSNQRQAGEGKEKDMDVEYKPEKEHPEEANAAEDFGKAKDGPGKMTSKKEDPELIKARARRSVDVARYYAATGVIPFDQDAIYAKAQELMGLEDSVFTTKEATVKEFPIVNRAALVEAHIPETEYGIVGNSAEGVEDPKATVKTEDMNSSVESDAKISSKASLVPQLTSENSGGLKLTGAFTTFESKMAKAGVNLQNARIRRPVYKSQ